MKTRIPKRVYTAQFREAAVRQVLAPGLFPLAVIAPALDRRPELIGDQFQQRRERRLIDAQDDAGETQVAELHREAQTVRGPAPLADDGQVGVAEGVVPDQVILGLRQRQEAFPLGGGQNRTARHGQVSRTYW